MILELGETIITIAQHTPDGVVIFFPSYDYLTKVVQLWQKAAPGSKTSTVYDRLSSLKPIFSESKTSTPSTTTDPNSRSQPTTTDILTLYTTVITASNSHKGAILLSVLSGTLSEGINFSDALGRAIIVIGLPYPNTHTAEWEAKISYLDNKARGLDNKLDGQKVSKQFIENVTMRSINQSIGRAIRHKNDYAAIFLIDRRYEQKRVREKLPGWIGKSIVTSTRGGDIGGVVTGFFRGKGDA
jgi:chromosome transmission fidelity protein 1